MQPRANKILLTALLLVLSGCLPPPPENRSFLEIRPGMEEQITLQPVRSNRQAEAVDLLRDDVRYEFDLSALPPKSQITSAVLKMYARSKGVAARVLSMAKPAELSPVLAATAFLESDIPFMDSRPVACRHSSVHWGKGADAASTVMMALGGSGGRVPYAGGPGWEEWDFTELIRTASRTGNTSISIRSVPRQIDLKDMTILSSTVLHVQMVYAGINDEVHRPVLMITFR